MWLRILSTVVSVARATGLDRKIKDWVLDKLDRTEDSAVEKMLVLQGKIDALKEKLEE